jgi:hypothetical protein
MAWRANAGAGQDVSILRCADACAEAGLGRSEPSGELDVGRIEDGLPMPLDRVGCYQQIGPHKSAGARLIPRVVVAGEDEHPCLYYTNVLWR